MLGHDWASREATLRSYELFAQEVIPYFRGQLAAPLASFEWSLDKKDELFARAAVAMGEAIAQHVEGQPVGTA